MSAPQLETVQDLFDKHSLPLLVQQRAGGRLLLHKSIRLPYVICQTLAASTHSDEEFFMIPLDNKGFYGAVSRHDEPTNAYATLSQILQPTLPDDSIDILIDNVTPVRLWDNGINKFTSKVLLPGEVIHVIKNKGCPLLTTSRGSSLCCFGVGSTETASDTLCVKDKSRHMHLDKHMISRFFLVNHGEFHKMESGRVYNLQDITQYQGLPKVVCCVSPRQITRDELPLPKVFRMVKVISDRVLLAYRLSDTNHPHQDDIVEISSYCQEKFAIAESSRVNMDDIRDHHLVMSIKRALPGKTLSYSDFQEIVRKSSALPPKLPGRPPTLVLKSADDKKRKSVDLRYFISSSNTQDSREKIDPNSRSMSHTVKLPTRDTRNRSILKKFSSVSAPANKNGNPSMRDILDKLHGKAEAENNNNNNKPKQRSKKSLRGLEIVHVLPDTESSDVIDLSKPLFTPKIDKSHPVHPSTISTTNSSQEDSRHFDDFIHSHYDFLDNHHDSSSYGSTPCSDGSITKDSESVNADSGMSSKSGVKFEDITFDSTVTYTPSTKAYPQNVGNNANAIRSLRQSFHRTSIESENTPPLVDHQEKISNSIGHDANMKRHTIGLNPSSRKVPAPDYDKSASCVLQLSEPANNGSGHDKPTHSMSKHPTGIETAKPTKNLEETAKPINHLEEIRNRFNFSANGGLKSTAIANQNLKNSLKYTEEPLKRMPSKTTPTIPTNPIDELKMRFSSQTSLETKQPTKVEPNTASRKPRANGILEDTYLQPIRSSGMIRLT